MPIHRITATEWQLKAAREKRLGALILPLVPQPTLHIVGEDSRRFYRWEINGDVFTTTS